MEFLLSQNLLLESSPKANEDPVVESKVKLYAKTKAALGLFWQEVQIRQTPGGEPWLIKCVWVLLGIDF